MSLILLVIGILITGAGVVTVAFGVPLHVSALGQTLITVGTTALVGGSLLVGLAATVMQLGAIVEVLRVRPAPPATARLTDARQTPDVRQVAARDAESRPLELRPPDPRPAEPTPAAAIEVSDSALARLRSSVVRPDRVVTNGEDVPLSPNGSGQHPAVESKPEPKAEPEARPGASPEAPRLDFLFRPKGPRPPSPPPEAFDAMWPQRRAAADSPRPDEVARKTGPVPPPGAGGEPRAPAEREPRSVAILKSGVVDGMAYTLYADGSIEAQLPHGTVRFGSIAELRAHIENNS